MKGEKLIHIQFEYFAGVQSKRDILSTEMDLVRMNQILKRYKEFRMQELEVKLALERKLRALKLDIGRLQNLLPAPEMPKILEKVHKKVIEEKEAGEEIVVSSAPALKIVREEPKKDDLDAQLREIQKKLNALAR